MRTDTFSSLSSLFCYGTFYVNVNGYNFFSIFLGIHILYGVDDIKRYKIHILLWEINIQFIRNCLIKTDVTSSSLEANISLLLLMTVPW